MDRLYVYEERCLQIYPLKIKYVCLYFKIKLFISVGYTEQEDYGP